MISQTSKTSRLTAVELRRQSSRVNGHANGAGPGKALLKKRPLHSSTAGLSAGHVEEGRRALLLAGKGTSACSIAVDYSAEMPHVEFTVGGRPLFSGHWEVALSIDGRPLGLSGEWEYLCWHSDENAHYLELQCLGDGAISVERQILLPRQGDFALLADAVLAPAGSRVDYLSTIPVSADVAIRLARHSRDCQLLAGKQVARVFPLTLPQDRIAGTAGALQPINDGANEMLQLQHAAPGRATYAPLVVDWNRSRRNSPADWRSLTVTEEGSMLRSEQAAGHRLRIGRDQWLIYRSLITSPEPRSVLGHQTRYETVVGRFNAKGDVKAILEIE